MKSQNVDKFNHDEDAKGYDKDVLNELNPIRAGYEELLEWVANSCEQGKTSTILDLGLGTGNLTQKIMQYNKIIGVDASMNMIDIAKNKLRDRTAIEFVQSDLLEFFESNSDNFDAIVSTYAIHHLTESEKHHLFVNIWDNLKSNGIAVFGDLMFENKKAMDFIFEEYKKNGKKQLVEDINDEIFWFIDTAITKLSNLGFKVKKKRFSNLSWGIVAKK